jgi:hypothetical protein
MLALRKFSIPYITIYFLKLTCRHALLNLSCCYLFSAMCFSTSYQSIFLCVCFVSLSLIILQNLSERQGYPLPSLSALTAVSITLCQTSTTGCIQFWMTALSFKGAPAPGNQVSQELYNPSTALNLNDIYNINFIQVNTGGVSCGFGSVLVSTIPWSICGGSYVVLGSTNGQ